MISACPTPRLTFSSSFFNKGYTDQTNFSRMTVVCLMFVYLLFSVLCICIQTDCVIWLVDGGCVLI